MSKIIATAAIRGAKKYVEQAEDELKTTTKAKNPDTEVKFPNTNYYLPLIYSLTGVKVETLADLNGPLKRAQSLLPQTPQENLWTPYLGDTLDAGIATLISQEIIEALKLVNGEEPKHPWLGFTDDSTLRTQGIKLVDGRMPGFAACVGSLPSNEQAVKLAQELQARNILVFMASSSNGKSMAEQLDEEGIEMSWDTFLVPYGKDTSAAVHALNFAARASLTFGGIEPGKLKEAKDILLYNRKRVHAFVLALGEDEGINSDQLITDEKYATAAGAINFGFPVISNVDLPEILPRGICRYEHVVSGIDLDKITNKAIEVRGVEIEASGVDVPVPFGAGFEGESVRKEEMRVEFGGQKKPAFELLRKREMDEVEDGKITLIGPDVDETIEVGEAMPLGIIAEVAGREFKEDFETIVERRFHEFISWASGIFHMGQRDIPWLRISKDSYEKGFRVRHFGEIINSKIKEDFSSIIDKVEVTLITDEDEIEKPLKEAKEIYYQRDERMAGMSDKDVDTFYSCTLCQSFAPDHVCIVTPERLGLCGAYTWLDCKAAHEMKPHGPNQPVQKGKVIDEKYGQWKGVNEFLARETDGNLERFSAYSMIKDPMTSCGCFEAIVAIVPEANGVMIVSREYLDMTPVGMTFSHMAGQVGGGIQTPGFIGIGKIYITSKKFISADVPDGHEGIERVVWMPKVLKDEIRGRLTDRLEEIGKPELMDKIATEDNAVQSDKLVEFLQEVEHPALEMEPIM